MLGLAKRVRDALGRADVVVDGDRPWDVQVHDARAYAAIACLGSLGLGNSYVAGWWECARIDLLVQKLLVARVASLSETIIDGVRHLGALLVNVQSRRRSRRVARRHYDLPDALYRAFLDPYLQYTCAYFARTDDLAVAQEHKLDLICRKLGLTSTDTVVDIGCGWGGFPKWAAERHGCHVTGVTISTGQAEFARRFCTGLPVDVTVSDYRDLRGTFSKALVCGMLEHVGSRNYRRLFAKVHALTDPEGVLLLHTIGTPTSAVAGDAWLTTHIFPGGHIPALAQIARASEGLFVVEDLHEFGDSYQKTLRAWFANFDRAWPTLAAQFDPAFYRLWKYYLLGCAGIFAARRTVLWQFVLRKPGPRATPLPIAR